MIATFLLLGAASAWAQPTGKVYRIGLLDHGSPDPARLEWWNAFRQRVREMDYVEGANIRFEPRWAHGKVDQVRSLAAELTRLEVDVIVTAGRPATIAAKQATSTIPIVTATGPDPVGLGVVASLARPGGNVTGVTSVSSELSGKRLELIRAVAPRVSRVTHLWSDIGTATPLSVAETQVAARSVGVAMQSIGVRDPAEFAQAFQAMRRDRAGAVMVAGTPIFFTHRKRLAELALSHQLPSVVESREYVEPGPSLAMVRTSRACFAGRPSTWTRS